MAKGASRAKPGSVKAEARQRIRIGRYQVVSRLGRGGMGMVYRGLDESLEREVAVKTLTAEGTFDEENRQRFEIEAKAAAKLQHPNIVTVYELGEDRGVPFIAMELLPGGDLESLLRSGEAVSLAERLEIVIQICRGLAFAHEHKIVHRDIKPSNIRLLDDGSVKIMDFGIAKLGSTNVTKSGMMVGTLNYMSPEQIRGLTLDGRSDVFSVGVMLFQLLTGRRPFVGTGGPDVLYKIVQDATPPLNVDLGPETPRLQEIVNRTLEKDPQRRYASASELADDLQRMLQGLLERTKAPVLKQAEQEALSGARRALKEGRIDEAQRRIEPLSQKAGAPEVLRLMRALRREQQQRAQPPDARTDDFAELEATYRAHVTQRTPDTFVGAQASTETRAPVATASPARWLIPIAGVLVVAVVGASVLLWRGQREPAPKPVQESGRPAPKESVPPPAKKEPPPPTPPVLAKLAVDSEPVGASVSLDGQRLSATPAQISLDPAKDHKLVVSLEGYAAQELRLPAGKIPASLQLTLEPAGPPGSLAVVSSYPVDVIWKGKLLAKGQVSPKVNLPPGRHALQVVSPSHFLKKDVGVEIKSGATAGVEMPGLGRISIKANPDNCEVSIDGVFVDYPPILDRAIAEGPHSVTFKWPDGLKRDEAVQVGKGQIVYVMGRRE